MSKSLQDQLLSLGLAQKKPKKTGRPHSGQKQNSHSGKAGPGRNQHNKKGRAPGKSNEEMDLSRAYALRRQEEKRLVETARKKKQEEDRRRRELNIALKAIVKEHRLNDPSAEVARNFMYKDRIRKIHLTPDQLKGVNSGELGVVYMLGGYHLLAAEHVETVRQLSADHVPDLSGSSDDDEDFPVPDDLLW